MSAREQLDNFVNRALTQYQCAELCQQDIIEVCQLYNDLCPSVDKFVFNNGARKELLNLEGTIPVAYQGQTYNIPLCIWFMPTHPFNPPMVFVRPTSNMSIKRGRHVDSNGKVYLPYLHEWKYPSSDIATLIAILSVTFGVDPPVFSNPTPGIASQQSSSAGAASRQLSSSSTGMLCTPDGSPSSLCAVCMEKEKVIAFFPCGHLTCADCSGLVNKCPECRGVIRNRLKIYL